MSAVAQQQHKLQASHAKQTALMVTMRTQAYTASLEQLAFGRLRAGVLVSRTVRVESHDPDFEFADEPFARLLGPEGGAFVHADSFSLVTRPVEDARAWDLELTTEGLPAREEGAFRGILVVEVGHDEVFEVEVPFSGVQF